MRGGVVRLVFVSAYAVAEGFRPTDGGGGGGADAGVDEGGW